MSQETKLNILANRLEKVLLESGSSRSTKPVSAAAGSSEYIKDFNDLINSHVIPFVKTCEALDGPKKGGALVTKAFELNKQVLIATLECKKPKQAELQKFLKDLFDVVMTADKLIDNRSEFFSHQSSIYEALMSMNWILQMPPMGAVSNAYETADFHLFKILTKAKSQDSKLQKLNRSFVEQLRKLLNELKAFVKEHFKAGLSWNPKGKDISSFSISGGSTTTDVADDDGGPPPAPMAPPPPDMSDVIELAKGGSEEKKEKATGMGAVFKQLQKGTDITKGLKTVTSDMKSKNIKAPPKEEKKKGAPAASSTAKKAAPAKKPPRKELVQGKWFIEYQNDTVIELEGVQMEESVYICKCEKTTVVIPGKFKSIALDGCKRLKLQTEQIVSTMEIVNCERVEIYALKQLPALAIDKSSGIMCNLGPELMKTQATKPEIYTSCISEVNIQLPDPKKDIVELPIPERYKTTIKNGKLHTEIAQI